MGHWFPGLFPSLPQLQATHMEGLPNKQSAVVGSGVTVDVGVRVALAEVEHG
jgi:hypothetical protein